MTSDAPVLIVPGIGGSGPEHWQSRWELTHPRWRRVEQRDWDNPVLEQWLAPLDSAVAQHGPTTILVAHSLGCLLVAHWACRAPSPTLPRVAAALLVAPPDPAGPSFPAQAATFGPTPSRRLPFPTLVVASTDDPYGSQAHAEHCARAWGSRFVCIGAAGHINACSGLGDWPQGLGLLEELTP